MGRGLLGVLLALLLVGSVGVAPPVSADDPTNDTYDPYFNEDEYQAFYAPPDPLPPGAPGDLIRTEPSRLVLEPSGQLGMIMADATRIMYRSTDVHGNPMAVTGTYFEPHNDWPGGGPRPLLVYGPGTQGQGDQCAPSRQFNQGIHWRAVPGPRVQLRGAVRLDDGRARIRDRDDRLSGSRHAGTAHLRRPRAAGQRDARRRPRRQEATGHVAEPRWAARLLGLLAGRRSGRVCSRARVVSTHRNSMSSAPMPAHRPPTSRSCSPTPTAASLSGAVGYALNSVITAYPEHADAIRSKLTPRGEDFLFKVARPVRRGDADEVHVPPPAAVLQRRHRPARQRRAVLDACSTSRSSAASNPMRP